MALAFQLAGAGHTAEQIDTEAVLTMEQQGGGWSITAIRLELNARVPGIDEATFQKHAEAAKTGCRIERIFRA